MLVNSWPSILLPKTNQIQLSVFTTIFHKFYLHSAPRLDQFNKIYISYNVSGSSSVSELANLALRRYTDKLNTKSGNPQQIYCYLGICSN